MIRIRIRSDKGHYEEVRARSEARTLAALERAAFAIEARAKLRAPVRTGNLRASLRAVRVADLAWRVGTHVHYAPFVELGTRKMAPRPYLIPAFEETIPQLLRELRGR